MSAPLAVLFDIDGTLINTGGAGARSWKYAFERLYHVDADAAVASEAGMTDPVVCRLTFAAGVGRDPSDQEVARLMGAYLERLPEEVMTSKAYRVLDGVEDLLTRLCDAGALLGLVSGNIEAAAHIKLSRAGLNRFFSFGGYGSDSSDRVELTRHGLERAGVIHGHRLNASTALVVGDTPRDIDAAHGAGAVAVGVASGNYPRSDLEAAGADHVLDSLTDPFPGL